MKKISLTLMAFASLTMATAAYAESWTGYRIGNYDYWDSNNGASYTGYRIGDRYYWDGHDSTGKYHSGSSYQIGRFTYYNQD